MNKDVINQHDAEGRKQGYWEEPGIFGFIWKGHYVDGLREGLWKGYHSDGTLRWRAHCHHGKQKGLEIRWAYQGRCTRKAYRLVIR
jgi:hypothetical protein